MAKGKGIVLTHPEKACIILFEESRGELHLRRDTNSGKYRVNGDNWRPTNDPGSPDAPSPWRRYGYKSLEEAIYGYKKEGWKESTLTSFECPCDC